MSDEFDCAKLLIVRNKFLCCVPVGEIGLKEYLKGISWNAQALLLDSTVKSVFLQQYPIRNSYQKAFLKLLIEVLEENCDEVQDIVYDTYCLLLNTVDEAKYSYKHYCIEDSVITLKENKNFISEGTTGLCSWQAGLALSEYCLANRHLLQRRTVLELGAGVGLVGITVALHCQPRAIYVTDCHPKVLAVLAENVALNLTGNPHTIRETITEISSERENSINLHTVKDFDSARDPLNCHTVKETSSARFDSTSTGDSSQSESVNRYTVKETFSARFDSIPVGNSAAHTITETLRRAGVDSSARVSVNCHTVKDTAQVDVQPPRFLNTSVGKSDKCVDKLHDPQLDQQFDSVLVHAVKDTVQLEAQPARFLNTSVGKSDKCVDKLHDTIFDQKFDSVLVHAVKDTVQLEAQPALSLNTSVGKSDKCVDKLHDTIFDQQFDSVSVHTVQDKETRVCVLNLPWERVTEIEFCAQIVPDLILAADVVYDSSVFQPLCETVSHFLNSNTKCEVIFACTERNSVTLNEFIKLLDTNHFNIRELSPPESKYFYWSTEIPIRFFLVTAL